jgi:hypothetical protein
MIVEPLRPPGFAAKLGEESSAAANAATRRTASFFRM